MEDSLMKRSLFAFGAILSIAGASGLIVFGDAIVGVFDGVLNYRLTDPPNPLPASMAELGWVAISGRAFAFGLVISCLATVMHDSQKTISRAGKILQLVAGVLFLIGTMPVLWGILVAKRGFMIIATSEAAPKPEDLRRMVEAASPGITAGCVVLLLGAAVMLVAGQAGVRTNPSQTIDRRSVLPVLAAIVSVVLGVVATLLFIGVWSHGSALEAILANTEFAFKPSDLARHLTGILNKSLAAFIVLGCQGVMQILVGVFVPSSRSRQAAA
jgi:hypothetical protein